MVPPKNDFSNGTATGTTSPDCLLLLLLECLFPLQFTTFSQFLKMEFEISLGPYSYKTAASNFENISDT